MPVTIVLENHEPKPHVTPQPATSLDNFLHRSCPDSYEPGGQRIVASSYAVSEQAGGELYSSSAGFLRSTIEAWGRHSHLVIRPEDVWFAILVQVNFYMEKHSDELRHIFVAHEGEKKTLLVVGGDWPEILDGFLAKVQNNIKTDWMSDWISPGFSTTTEDDETVATALMMGMMKSYFEYVGDVICGIPSITLLGTQQDWQRLLNKSRQLSEFGSEPKEYANRLFPILSRIVKTFAAPDASDVKMFWDQIVQAKVRHASVCGEPPQQYIISGWILGLFYWNKEGAVDARYSEGLLEDRRGTPGLLELDGVQYGAAALENLPVGYTRVPFIMASERGESAGKPLDGWLIAGSMGKLITTGAPEGYWAHFGRRRQQVERPQVETEGSHSGRFRAMLRSLNCFSSRKHSPSIKQTVNGAQLQSEKDVGPGDEKTSSDILHSTIQPMSGWFLGGPSRDLGPFFDGEEISGPTTDAIDSCEGTKRYGKNGYQDFGSGH